MRRIFTLTLLVIGVTTKVLTPAEENIMKDLSWPSRMLLWKDILDSRPVATKRVGIESLVLRAGDDLPPMEETGSDDNAMKMKLFRLMYESVRDSDMKVKRAEQIKKNYVSSMEFEIGFLMGDIQDKLSVMWDVANTLKRQYDEWKPIEHITAYEQIANQAIEINHLVDIVRSIYKSNSTS